MEELQENQDGTLKGGFSSIYGYKTEVDIEPSFQKTNTDCQNSKCNVSSGLNKFCENDSCGGTTNRGNCMNSTCFITGNNLGENQNLKNI